MTKYGFEKLIHRGNEIRVPLERTLFDTIDDVRQRRKNIQVQACLYGGRHGMDFVTKSVGDVVVVRRVK